MQRGLWMFQALCRTMHARDWWPEKSIEVKDGILQVLQRSARITHRTRRRQSPKSRKAGRVKTRSKSGGLCTFIVSGSLGKRGHEWQSSKCVPRVASWWAMLVEAYIIGCESREKEDALLDEFFKIASAFRVMGGLVCCRCCYDGKQQRRPDAPS